MVTTDVETQAAEFPPLAVAVTAPLRPGDTLVVASPQTGSQAATQALVAALESELAGVRVVVVSGCTGLATYTAPGPVVVTSADAAEAKTNGKTSKG